MEAIAPGVPIEKQGQFAIGREIRGVDGQGIVGLHHIDTIALPFVDPDDVRVEDGEVHPPEVDRGEGETVNRHQLLFHDLFGGAV